MMKLTVDLLICFLDCDHEESFSQHEESSVDNEEDSAIPQKRKQVKNSDLDGNEPVKGKKTTKRKKALKSKPFPFYSGTS